MIRLLYRAIIFSLLTLSTSLSANIDEEVLLLLVDKGDLTATLQTWPILGKEVKTLMKFKIAIGKEKGDKQYEGDNKTPEGIYFVNRVIDGKLLPEKYGPLALPINFPNKFDRDQGKTGHGIWLHGVADDSRIEKANVTEGCVAFYNADIKLLKNWLKPRQSVVMITDNTEDVNQKSSLEDIRKNTDLWFYHWSQKNLDKYISFYHPKFKNKGKKLSSYKRYKKRIFKKYKQMKMSLYDLRVFVHEKYAVSTFNQDFWGDNSYVSKGRKVLFWYKNQSGKWKIAHETYEDRRFNKIGVNMEIVSEMFEESPSKAKLKGKEL